MIKRSSKNETQRDDYLCSNVTATQFEFLQSALPFKQRGPSFKAQFHGRQLLKILKVIFRIPVAGGITPGFKEVRTFMDNKPLQMSAGRRKRQIDIMTIPELKYLQTGSKTVQ